MPAHLAEEERCFDGLGTNGIRGLPRFMIDNFSLALTHGLMLLAVWRLIRRPDLDQEASPRDAIAPKRGRWGQRDA